MDIGLSAAAAEGGVVEAEMRGGYVDSAGGGCGDMGFEEEGFFGGEECG